MSKNSCDSKCSLDWAFAHLILRLWVGLRLFMAGLDKLREKGGDGFGFQFIEKSMAPIIENMGKYANTHVLPIWAIKPYAMVLPWALLITGVASVLGICTRFSLFLGGMTFVSLAFGLMAMPDDDQAVYRGIEVAITALALMTASANKFSVDGLLCSKKGGCCAKEEAAE